MLAKTVDFLDSAFEYSDVHISRYISTTRQEPEIDLKATHAELLALDEKIKTATDRHNQFLKELGLPLLPQSNRKSERDECNDEDEPAADDGSP